MHMNFDGDCGEEIEKRRGNVKWNEMSFVRGFEDFGEKIPKVLT